MRSLKEQPTNTQLSGSAILDETSDRRTVPRFRVQFRTLVSVTGRAIETRGSILDLSLGGCRVESPLVVEPSILLELRIYIPGLDWPGARRASGAARLVALRAGAAPRRLKSCWRARRVALIPCRTAPRGARRVERSSVSGR